MNISNIDYGTAKVHAHGALVERDQVSLAIDIIASGGMVIVVDDDKRENEGDLIASASTITPEMVAFMVNNTTGILCAAMSGARADAWNLPPMVETNTDPHATAFTVTCDAVNAGTGVSAKNRTMTLQLLASVEPQPTALRRPGHIFPLRAREGGVLTRDGHTEATFDLVRLAGHIPVGVLCELVNPDGSMMCGAQIDDFALKNGLLKISIAQMIEWRKSRNDL